jgi:predicted MFS family arabinose efflux permease
VTAGDRARAISRVAVIGYTGFFVGPPLMGFVSEAVGLRGSFAAVGGLMLAAPLALLLLAGRRRG